MKKQTQYSAQKSRSKFKSNLSLAAVAVFMSINTAWAAAECNVFTTDAAGSSIPRTSVAPVGADNVCYLGTYTPEANDQKNGQAIADGAGSEISLKGVGGQVFHGASGLIWGDVTDPALFDARQGGISDPIVDITNKYTVGFNTQANPTTVPDPITGSNMTIKTFSNATITHQPSVGTHFAMYAPAGGADSQYIDMRMATASNGGKVKVDLTDVGSTIDFLAKQTTLFEANTGGSIEWEGNNRLFTGETYAVVSQTGRLLRDVTFHTYQDVDFLGTTYHINNLSDLHAYNNALIEALRNGTFPMAGSGRTVQDYENAYRAQLYRAVRTERVNIYSKLVASPTDDRAQDDGRKWIMHAIGANSKIKMKAGSALVNYIQAQAMRVDDGASGEIEAGARLSGYGNNVVVEGQGSSFDNRGVISSGFSALNPSIDSSNTTPGAWIYADGDYHFDGYAATVNNGATFNNEGIINISSSDQWYYHNYGISLNGSQATNAVSGVINVAINNNGRGPWGFTVSGVRIGPNDNLSIFDNQGEIYVGRTAQQTPGAATVDTEEKQRTYGIWQQGKATVSHSGNITLGTKIENSIAYFLDGATDSTVNLTDRSSIVIKGDKGGLQATNYGLYAKNTGNSVINADGRIEVEGVNVRAVQAEGNSTVNIGSTGRINITGGRDGIRSYAVYAEGFSPTEKATVNFAGNVNLAGTGAIGLHARGHAEINNNGAVEMTAGRDQIGYFLYGKDAKLIGGASTLDVTTEGSTMFRLAKGATFDVSGMSITTSGKNSTAIIVTGESDDTPPVKSAVSTAGGTFNLTGEGSNFITVEGGAQADLDGSSKINLSGKGAVIGIVDGQGYGLFKDPDGSVKTDSRLNSALSTETDLEGVNTYIARTQGSLNYNGSHINLYGKDSIAFKMEDGGKLNIAEGSRFAINGDFIRSNETNSYSNANGGYTNTASLERNDVNATNVLNAQSGKIEVESHGQSLLTGAALMGSGAQSHLKMSDESVWNITASSKLTNFINQGTVNFVQTIANPQNKADYDSLTIEGNYLGRGGSTITVNSNWYQPNATYTNSVLIKGNANGRTRVLAAGGIGGDVTAPQAEESGVGIEKISDTLIRKYDPSSPVITVLGQDNDNQAGRQTFVGEAQVTNSALIAQLIKKGKHYYWTLTHELPGKTEDNSQTSETQPIPLYVKESGGYLQTPFINREMGLDLLGKVNERVGEQQFDCNCIAPQSWSRLSYTDQYHQGKERFAFAAKRGLVQFGQDLSVNVNETRRVHTGLTAGYSWSNNRFYDKYSSENGVVKNDKETLGSKSQVASLGAYRTTYFDNGSYLDLTVNGIYVRNQYRQDSQQRLSQQGYGAGTSVEFGRLFKLGESNWHIQPQAQLKGQYLQVSRLNDGVRRSESSAQTTLQGRVGARITNGHFYVSANLVHDFLRPKAQVKMGTSELKEQYNPTYADIAVGGDIGLDSARKWQIYGDVKYSRALARTNNIFTKKGPAESYSGRLGIRYSW